MQVSSEAAAAAVGEESYHGMEAAAAAVGEESYHGMDARRRRRRMSMKGIFLNALVRASVLLYNNCLLVLKFPKPEILVKGGELENHFSSQMVKQIRCSSNKTPLAKI